MLFLTSHAQAEPAYLSKGDLLERELARNTVDGNIGATISGAAFVGAGACVLSPRILHAKHLRKITIPLCWTLAVTAPSALNVMSTKYSDANDSKHRIGRMLEVYLGEIGEGAVVQMRNDLLEGIPLPAVLNSAGVARKRLPTRGELFERLPQGLKNQIINYNASIGAE